MSVENGESVHVAQPVAAESTSMFGAVTASAAAPSLQTAVVKQEPVGAPPPAKEKEPVVCNVDMVARKKAVEADGMRKNIAKMLGSLRRTMLPMTKKKSSKKGQELNGDRLMAHWSDLMGNLKTLQDTKGDFRKLRAAVGYNRALDEEKSNKSVAKLDGAISGIAKFLCYVASKIEQVGPVDAARVMVTKAADIEKTLKTALDRNGEWHGPLAAYLHSEQFAERCNAGLVPLTTALLKNGTRKDKELKLEEFRRKYAAAYGEEYTSPDQPKRKRKRAVVPDDDDLRDFIVPEGAPVIGYDAETMGAKSLREALGEEDDDAESDELDPDVESDEYDSGSEELTSEDSAEMSNATALFEQRIAEHNKQYEPKEGELVPVGGGQRSLRASSAREKLTRYGKVMRHWATGEREVVRRYRAKHKHEGDEDEDDDDNNGEGSVGVESSDSEESAHNELERRVAELKAKRAAKKRRMAEKAAEQQANGERIANEFAERVAEIAGV